MLAALITSGASAPALADWGSCKAKPLPRAKPEAVGLDRELAADLEALLADAVDSRFTAQAAAAIGRAGKLVVTAYAGGARADSLFDLASLTKVIATAPSLLLLVERAKLSLADAASRYLPLLETDDKRAITVSELLLHTSGLHSSVWAGPKSDGREQILPRIRKSALKYTPGSSYKYSDLGYVVLGELVAARAGAPLDRWARAQLYEPLGMCSTGFLPPPAVRSRLISPWPAREEQRLGVVYDPIAARTGGVSGHAGLYSTAEDLARFGLMMLGRGALGGKRVLAARTVAQMLEPRALPGGKPGKRGLGWDYSTPYAGSRGALSGRAFGHTGFTGTSLWVDPELDLALVLLTNRTHLADPGGEHAPSVSELRRTLHNTVVASLVRPPARPVRCGLDRLVEDGFSALRGRKVGLITNRTAVDAGGRWIVDLLQGAPAAAKVELRALFMPEHGLEGKVDRRIEDGALRRGKRRLPVYSLFGSRRRPTAETLEGIDTLVIDLQTVGVRYYTYLATMGWAMEEAAARGLRFVVLDRPDPLGGAAVQGPVSSAERRTSTNYHPVPVRYGMTLGELARMFKGERKLKVALEVIKASGWSRGQLFPETGLPWVDPSPNIRSFRQAVLYAGVGLLESTNLAVGRGTESPFQLLGAPWIDGKALARSLNRRRLPGVRFAAVSFTPSANPYRGQRCSGVRLVVHDLRAIDPPAIGVALALELRKRHADRWETKHLYRLINDPPTTQAILAGKELAPIVAGWRAGLERFRKVRARYLLY